MKNTDAAKIGMELLAAGMKKVKAEVDEGQLYEDYMGAEITQPAEEPEICPTPQDILDIHHY